MLNKITPASIVSTLTKSGKFNDLLIVEAYENEIKPTPITEPIAALSAKGCKIGECMTSTLSNGEIVKTLSRPVETQISVDIYLPYSMGGSEGHKIFDRIAEHLMYVEKQSVSAASCGASDYNKSCQAIILRGVLTYNTVTANK